MTKRILIAVGGTGGHVFPALALADQLRKVSSDMEIAFVGGGLSENKFFDPSSKNYLDISCATTSGKNAFQKVKGAVDIAKGFTQSRSFLKEWNPDVIVGFGSYHTLPTLNRKNDPGKQKTLTLHFQEIWMPRKNA